MHAAYVRPGGVSQDLPIGLLDDIYEWIQKYPTRLGEVDSLVSQNPVFIARTKNVAVVPAEEALNLGFTGVMLRGSGIKWVHYFCRNNGAQLASHNYQSNTLCSQRTCARRSHTTRTIRSTLTCRSV